MVRRTLPALAALAATAAFAAGCGTNMDAENPNGKQTGVGNGMVAEQDVARVLTAIRTIDALCEGAKPTQGALGDATSTLLDVWRLGPQAVLKYGSNPQAQSETMQTAVVLQSRRLQRCGDSQDAARIQQAAGTKITAVQP